MEKTLDDLIGWLHSMAELAHADLVTRFDDECKESLSKLVNLCLPSQTVPADLSSEEFAQWVHDLKTSERDWNRALGAVIVKAEDAHASGDRVASVRLLSEFAAGCPWIPLKDIADGEARRHQASPGDAPR